jgi:hypothetical protein
MPGGGEEVPRRTSMGGLSRTSIIMGLGGIRTLEDTLTASIPMFMALTGRLLKTRWISWRRHIIGTTAEEEVEEAHMAKTPLTTHAGRKTEELRRMDLEEGMAMTENSGNTTHRLKIVEGEARMTLEWVGVIERLVLRT